MDTRREDDSMTNVEKFLAGPVSYHQVHKRERMQFSKACEVCQRAVDALLRILGIGG